MKKFLLAMLALVLAFSFVFVGCDSADTDSDDKSDSKAASSSEVESSEPEVIDLTGTWEAEIDIGELLTQSIAASLNAEIETIEFKATIALKFDGEKSSMKMTAKEDSEKVVDIMLDLAYQIVLEQGVEMTFEDYLVLVEQENLMPDLEAQADQVIKSLEVETDTGDYTVEGNVIKYSDGDFEIEFKDDSFTVKKITLDDEDSLEDMEKQVFDLIEGSTFKKAK